MLHQYNVNDLTSNDRSVHSECLLVCNTTQLCCQVSYFFWKDIVIQLQSPRLIEDKTTNFSTENSPELQGHVSNIKCCVSIPNSVVIIINFNIKKLNLYINKK